jgi:Immunoglobulin-like domain of bacterial spore germination
MSNRILYTIIGIAVVFGILATIINYFIPLAEAPVDTTADVASTTEAVFCTADAMMCPDGSYVGRTGPNCEFVCPAAPEIPADLQAHIDSKADMIKVMSPLPMSTVTSPFVFSGEARGNWFFEASAPVTLVNWDGLIIAEGFVTADGEWMTTDFVPFSGTLEFESPYKEGDPDFMKRGALIFKKDNPSGLPEKDDALEFTVWFAK